MNEIESTPSPSQSKLSALIYSSNNDIIHDPLIQSFEAKQTASVYSYDLLSHQSKRVNYA